MDRMKLELSFQPKTKLFAMPQIIDEYALHSLLPIPNPSNDPIFTVTNQELNGHLKNLQTVSPKNTNTFSR